MTIKKSFYIKLLLLMLLCLLLPSCGDVSADNAIETAFSALKVDFEEMWLVAWRCFADEFLSVEEMRSVLISAAEALGAETISEAADSSEEYQSLTMMLQEEDTQFTLIAQSIPTESYLIISAVSRGELQDFSALLSRLTLAVGEPCSLNVFLAGSHNGNMQESWQQQIADAMNACEAQQVEAAENEGYYSSTAYCPFLLEAVLAGGNVVNLQIAAGYDEKKQRSYYYLGYPLLYNDY